MADVIIAAASLAMLPLLFTPAAALLLNGRLIHTTAALLSLAVLGSALVYRHVARTVALECYSIDRFHCNPYKPKKFKKAEQRRFERKLAGVPYNTQGFGGVKSASSLCSVSLMTASSVLLLIAMLASIIYIVGGAVLFDRASINAMCWLALWVVAQVGYTLSLANAAASTRGAAACFALGAAELLCAADLWVGFVLNVNYHYSLVSLLLHPTFGLAIYFVA